MGILTKIFNKKLDALIKEHNDLVIDFDKEKELNQTTRKRVSDILLHLDKTATERTHELDRNV